MSLNDQELVGTVELAADGTDTIFTSATVTSTTSGSKQVQLSGIDLFREPEELEAGDKVTLTGTTAADGTYTVDAVLALDLFTVVEAISSSTGGTCDAKYPPGARKVGFDSSGLANTSATNVQKAIEDMDAAVTPGGVDRNLRIHFLLMGG